ncbi:alpha/beta fold hydrolase [candidate division KSB1 bacterium]
MTVPSADGVPIRYDLYGAGEPALVFVHGWCSHRAYWNEQVHHFADQYRVVALDLAGHGESGRGRRDWTMVAFGADVAAVIEAVAPERAVLVGHSMGGPVCLEASLRLPEKMIGLVGVDSFRNVGSVPPSEELDRSMQGFLDNYEEDLYNLSLKLFQPGTDPELIERVNNLKRLGEIPPREIALDSWREFWRFDYSVRMPKVKGPIRCINSRFRGETDVESGKSYAPDFEVVYQPDVGHYGMMEDPEGFNRLLAALIEEFTVRQGG